MWPCFILFPLRRAGVREGPEDGNLGLSGSEKTGLRGALAEGVLEESGYPLVAAGRSVGSGELSEQELLGRGDMLVAGIQRDTKAGGAS